MPTLAETSIPSTSVPYGTNLELIDHEDDMEQAAEPVPPYTTDTSSTCQYPARERRLPVRLGDYV